MGPGDSGPGKQFCHISLSLKNVLVADGKVYCKKCVPKMKHTAVVDIMSQHASQAQEIKNNSSANQLGKSVHQTKEKFTVIKDDLMSQHASQAQEVKNNSSANQLGKSIQQG